MIRALHPIFWAVGVWTCLSFATLGAWMLLVGVAHHIQQQIVGRTGTRPALRVVGAGSTHEVRASSPTPTTFPSNREGA